MCNLRHREAYLPSKPRYKHRQHKDRPCYTLQQLVTKNNISFINFG